VPRPDEQPEQEQRHQRRAPSHAHRPSSGEAAPLSVIAGPDPTIHPVRKTMDARVMPAHDDAETPLTSAPMGSSADMAA
jgi:hypothetical protein